jgi:hypothetical protein
MNNYDNVESYFCFFLGLLEFKVLLVVSSSSLFNWQTLAIFQPVLLKHYNALTSKICHGHSFVQK